ncbi:alpha/beta hydrolase [Enterococcus sp. AZ109]|uniref:alpha/beta hydrolase n=1 Tax=Enterococcus sp. AZ109 TaxID=2774634 RepID=UPI003F28003D
MGVHFFYGYGNKASNSLTAIPKTPNNEESTPAAADDLLTTDDTIGQMIHHPAFDGFGELLLPWDNRSVDEELSLERIDELMPYHNHVDPEVSVAAVNRLISDQQAGNTIFYDIYSEEEKADNPEKENTGLFFYKGEPGQPFAMIAPCGGFSYVGSLHEGFPYADEISKQGYNAFVLKYEVGNERVATEDLGRALAFITTNAEELEVATTGYSLWGSSAGARMVARIGSDGAASYGGNGVGNPAAVITAYTGHQAYSENDAPTFAVVSEDDPIASAATMRRRIQNLTAANVPAEILTFENVGHGFGLGVGTEAEGWLNEAIAFWKEQM